MEGRVGGSPGALDCRFEYAKCHIYLKKRPHMARLADENSLHVESLGFEGRIWQAEALIFSAAYRTWVSSYRSHGPQSQGSREPDLEKEHSQTVCLICSFPGSECSGTPMALLWPLWFAVCLAEGQTLVAPAELMLLRLFLRLLHRQGVAAALRHGLCSQRGALSRSMNWIGAGRSREQASLKHGRSLCRSRFSRSSQMRSSLEADAVHGKAQRSWPVPWGNGWPGGCVWCIGGGGFCPTNASS